MTRKSYIILNPPRTFQWLIPMPATRFGDHQGSGFNLEFSAMTLIDSFAAGNVVDLVFVQNTALLIGKMVAGRVRTGRIEHIRRYLCLSGTVEEEAPVLVLLGRI